jgi:Xaa-Pro aminopeptidase
VLRAQLAALELAKEGIGCYEMDFAARHIINNAGYGKYFGHALGHGVGMYVHESPNLSPRSPRDKVLKVGHIVTVEPGIYIEGKYGCRIEDMIGVTEQGIVNFAHSTKELIEIY